MLLRKTPFAATEDSISVVEALESGLNDCSAAMFKHLQAGEVKTISEAIEPRELTVKDPSKATSTIKSEATSTTESVITSTDTVTDERYVKLRTRNANHPTPFKMNWTKRKLNQIMSSKL